MNKKPEPGNQKTETLNNFLSEPRNQKSEPFNDSLSEPRNQKTETLNNFLSEHRTQNTEHSSSPSIVKWHSGAVTYSDRCKLLGQKGAVLWFTGLSGSGKSTIAVELEKRLTAMGKLCYRLDGDNLRHGLNSDLGFSKEEREENIRRVAEVAALFKDAGVITLVSFIAPYRQMREFARKVCREGFREIYVKASLDICKQRDPKGLYEKAEKGEISDFTGVSAPYEEPENPDLVLDTSELSVVEAVEKVLEIIN